MLCEVLLRSRFTKGIDLTKTDMLELGLSYVRRDAKAFAWTSPRALVVRYYVRPRVITQVRSGAWRASDH
ncbi:hypothetical protein N9L68_07695 [bacterium]|nr:hypothetical protein [bacterium]